MNGKKDLRVRVDEETKTKIENLAKEHGTQTNVVRLAVGMFYTQKCRNNFYKKGSK